jgi:isopentenyl-diphosphate delta-isomerase
MTRERHLVELVAEDGTPIGESTVDKAHRAPGLLHRAFSVLLIDADRRTLLQRRAAVKTRFPLVWANTCCGHPLPGESPVAAATRRLREELGVRGVDLAEVGVHTYAAGDPATGRYEREYDHVVVGRAPADLILDPDPAEVVDTRWEEAAALLDRVSRPPATGYAPWLPGVLAIACRSSLVAGAP